MTDHERIAQDHADQSRAVDAEAFASLGLITGDSYAGSFYLNTWLSQPPQRVFNVTVSNSSR